MLPSALATISLSGSVGVGLIFVIAAVSKLQSRVLLPGVIANYRLLPAGLVEPVALALPFVELGLGLALICGLSGVVPVLAAALLWVFAAAMAVNIRRGRGHIDCGCGRSQLRQRLSWGLVGRNLVLSLLVAPRVIASPPPAVLDLVTAAFGGASIYLLYLVFNSLGALAAPPVIATRT